MEFLLFSGLGQGFLVPEGFLSCLVYTSVLTLAEPYCGLFHIDDTDLKSVT